MNTISDNLTNLNLPNPNILDVSNDYLFEIKRRKLISFALSIIESPLYAEEFRHIFALCGVTQEEVLASFLDYNLDIFSPEGNDIYNSLTNRIVLHIHNLLEGSWHIARQNAMVNFIKEADRKNLVDIGFGVPSRYIKKTVLQNSTRMLTLCDLYNSAFIFAEILLGYWDSNWKDKILFKNTDMDKHEFVGDFDMYIFQDSIEHTPNPTCYLEEYVKKSPPHANFLFSLPIGPIIPRHFIAWETSNQAMEWLKKCGLSKIEKTEYVSVNPNVDLFAEQLNYNFHNLIILCSK